MAAGHDSASAREAPVDCDSNFNFVNFNFVNFNFVNFGQDASRARQ